MTKDQIQGAANEACRIAYHAAAPFSTNDKIRALAVAGLAPLVFQALIEAKYEPTEPRVQ